MGTPHRGAASAKIAAIATRVLSLLWLHSVPEIVEAIRYDSHELRDMHRRFEAVSEDFTIVNFYELLKQPNLGGRYQEYVSITEHSWMSVIILMAIC